MKGDTAWVEPGQRARLSVSTAEREVLQRWVRRPVAREVGSLALKLDVRREEEIRPAVARAEAEAGPIDLFSSNAGVSADGGSEVPDLNWQRTWQVNVMAHVSMRLA